MKIREVIADVAINGEDRFIECMDEKDFYSRRSMAFFERKKMGDFAKEVGIQRFRHGDKFFVRVHKKKTSNVWAMIDGKMVEVVADSELIRVVDMMRKDGKSQEEIDEIVSSWDDNDE